MTSAGWSGPARRAWVSAAAVAVAALGLALSVRAYHPNALASAVGIGAGGVALLAVCGDALAVLLVPAAWRAVRPLFALGFGAVASGLALMGFGVARVPFCVSLWVVLALGLGASVCVRRSSRSAASPDGGDPAFCGRNGGGDLHSCRRTLRDTEAGPWLAVSAVLFLVLLVPAWRTGALTVFGQNPDSSQVVGIAVLFQHVPPTGTDLHTPLNVVPPEWRFRYPIFYPLAAVAALVHADPIRVFPVLVALLVVIAAFGFGMVAVRCFGAPRWAGPLVSGLIGMTWVLQYLAWHPYWNQLWGTALMPYAVLFGWQGLAGRDARAGIAAALFLLMLWFAYPLALPYPLVLLAAVAWAHWRRPRLVRPSGRRAWLLAIGGLALLAPAVVGAVAKLAQGVSQLVTPGSTLWGGDVTHLLSVGRFAGVGTGPWAVAGAIVVLAAGALALVGLPRREAIGVGAALGALLLLDLRFRLTASGAYMDFKHLSFVGLFVVTLALAGLLARAATGSPRVLVGAGLALVVWTGAALALDHRDAAGQNQQVSPELFQIRAWARALPPHASVRIDIPPAHGGLQLWAVYMVGDHPVDSYEPLLGTTYAHAAPGFRADYSLSLSRYPAANPLAGRPFPEPRYTVTPPVFQNQAFVLRRIDWPASQASVPDTASRRLVP